MDYLTSISHLNWNSYVEFLHFTLIREQHNSSKCRLLIHSGLDLNACSASYSLYNLGHYI